MPEPNVDEETQKADDEPSKAGDKHPETVSWGQYVGIKESLGKKLDTATQKVGTLEEQLKGTISKEEHDKVQTALDAAKTAEKTATDELKTSKDATLAEKRSALVKKGVPEDKAASMSVEQLDSVLGVVESLKPAPDLSGGGGGSAPTSAKEKMKSAFDDLHPSDK